MVTLEKYGYVDRRTCDRDVGTHRRHYENPRLVAKKMMNIQHLLHRFIWVPWSLLVFGLLVAIVIEVIEPVPPIKFTAARSTLKVIPPGGLVTIEYDSIRDRTCLATISLGWVDKIGSVVMRLDPIRGGLGRLGPQTNRITVAAPYQPGFYCFRLAGHHDCGKDEFDIVAPEACLEVIG